MITNLFNDYVKEIEGLRLTIETLKEGMPKKIEEDMKKYKTSLLIDLYFSKKIAHEEDKQLEEKLKDIVTICNINYDKKIIAYKLNQTILNTREEIIDVEDARKRKRMYINILLHLYDSELISLIIKFENTISKIFSNIIEKYPKVYLDKKSVEFSKVVAEKDIETFKKI